MKKILVTGGPFGYFRIEIKEKLPCSVNPMDIQL
jgi:hypothetical protein